MNIQRVYILVIILLAINSASNTLAKEIQLTPLESSLNNVSIQEDGAAVVADRSNPGSCTWDVFTTKGEVLSGIRIDASIKPPASHGLAAHADVLTQIRWKLPDGSWSEWFPENILPGGNFPDSNNSGIPDSVHILNLTSPVTVLSDISKNQMPDWVDIHTTYVAPSLIEEHNNQRILHVSRADKDGQTIVMMKSDRIPPACAVTVSGWNGWRLPRGYTMGLMSRLHEIDAYGNRLNKIMFIGDDDFCEPGETAPLHWRAVSFVPRLDTVRLNLYPARLIESEGELMVSHYQVRTDSLADSAYRGEEIYSYTFEDLKGWEIQDPFLVETHNNSVIVKPHPLTYSYLLSPVFEIPEVECIALSVEMDIEVPRRYNDYDPSHKAWMSTYLELLNDKGALVDAIKVSACRPRFGDILAAAGQRRPDVRLGRVRLVASHISYLMPKEKIANMDGVMISRWRNLRIFVSRYPQGWRGRLDEEPLNAGEIPPAEHIQVRTILLADTQTPTPVLKNVLCSFSPE